MFERTDIARKDAAGTEAEYVARQMDVVDLIVAGASLRQVATHYKSTSKPPATTTRPDSPASSTPASTAPSLSREEVTAHEQS